MWRAIGLVSSGLTLAAFMVAVAAWVYKARLDHRERVLKNTPPEKRGEAALEILEASRIDPSNLSQRQRFELALRELEAKTARFRTTAIIISFIAALGVSLAVYAISRPSSSQQSLNETVTGQSPPLPSPKDARLAAGILGTWKSHAKLPEGVGWHVQDLQYTVAKNGWIEWRGTYIFAGTSYPILMSGDWSIEDGNLLYTVKQSNVAAIPQGFHGVTSIVDVTDTRLDYFDSGNNGTLTSDLRIQ